MKKIFALLLGLLLCACSSNVNINEQLDRVFSDTTEIIRQNNFSKFIDYYCPSDLMEDESNKLTFSFMYNDSRVVVNVNISGIINNVYYKDKIIFNEGFFDDSKLFYSLDGKYVNANDIENNFQYSVYEYKDKYLLYFNSNELIAYSYCDKNDIVPISSRIFVLAKSSSVKKQEIIANYSSKDVIDYHKVQVDLFESVLPVNGRLDDMMLDKVQDSGQQQ